MRKSTIWLFFPLVILLSTVNNNQTQRLDSGRIEIKAHGKQEIEEEQEVKVVPEKPKKVSKPKKSGDLSAFMRHMGRIEGGRYDVVNRTGHLGLYQFNPRTLAGLGFKVERDEFLSSPKLQDQAMIAYMKQNSKVLRGVINKYSGKVINDVYVTKAGILAAAHLVGPGGVLAFFYPERYEFKTHDSNGTTAQHYMTLFSRYNVEL